VEFKRVPFEIERVEDRREKHYGARLQVAVYATLPERDSTCRLASRYYLVQEELHKLPMPGEWQLLWMHEPRVHPPLTDGYSITLFRRAEKPSAIPKSAETLAVLATADGLPDLHAWLEDAIRAALAREDAHVAQLKRREQATQVAAHVGKLADARARQACRYEERLAGLMAEFEASRKTALAAVAAEVTADCAPDGSLTEPDGGAYYAPCVIRAGLAHAAEWLPSTQPFLGLGMGTRPEIPLDEVK